MEWFFLKLFFRQTTRYFRTRRIAKTITAALFLALALLIAWGIYAFFLHGFRSIAEDLFFRRALLLYVNELFSLALFFLIFAGSAITSLFVLFRRPYDYWIFASPHYRAHAEFAFFRVFLTSFWPFLFVGIPALLAARAVFGIGAGGFIVLSFVLLLHVVVSVLAGLLLVFISAWALAHLPRRFPLRLSIGTLGIVVVLLFSSGVIASWDRIASSDILSLFYATDVERIEAGIDRISNTFWVFPSHLTARALFSIMAGEGRESVYPILGGVTLFVTLSGFYIGLAQAELFLWSLLQEGKHAARPNQKPAFRFFRKPFPRFFSGALGALFEKEFLLIARSTRNLLWVGFLFFLWILQTGLNIVLSRAIIRSEFDPAFVSPVVLMLQFLTMIFFISAFVLRFAFPSFSQEGKTVWVLLSSPIDFGKVFVTKLYFFSTVFLLFGILTSLLNSWIVGFSIFSSLFIILFFSVAICFLTGVGLSLGALFPNFETDDPEVLSTSLPGLLFIFISLMYGTFSGLALYSVSVYEDPRGILIIMLLSLGAIVGMRMFVPPFLRASPFVKVLE